MSNRSRFWIALLAIATAAGCGSGRDHTDAVSGRSAQSSKPPRPGLCRVGGPALAVIPAAPEWWREGKRPPIVLGCAGGGTALVGFETTESACVASYRFKARETFNERCAEPGTSWTLQCEGRLGCTSAFAHERGLTVLNGPLDSRVERIEVAVDGKRLRAGVTLAAVKGRLMKAIGAREPFGFFFVAIPRCVMPAAVRIELFSAGGARLGTAQPWDVIVDRCPGARRQGAPAA
jgi:hypothetical protein